MTIGEKKKLNELVGNPVHLTTIYGGITGFLEKPSFFRVNQGGSYIEFEESEIERVYFDKFWTISLKQKTPQGLFSD